MVIAGPGTGKTQTLSMRVANILKTTQMRPGNILCLTFSVSGATAMRDRLRSLIGPDAYGVTVSTIHAFAQSVIDAHPQVFADWSVREQISDIDRYRALNAIIDDLIGKTELINPKDPYGKDTDILSRISQVKREGKTLKDLLTAADAYDTEMAGKSKPTTKAHVQNLLRARKFRDFIEIFRLYTAMLDRTGRYDYDDMLLHVLRAMREEDWLLAGLQERYQYILVDEAQDLNGAQFELVNRLTTYEHLSNDPNVFIVGDDDQSIYRFQGANVRQMLAFHERFPRAPVIALTESYRSTQHILDAARMLISCNHERLVGQVPGLVKDLHAAGDAQGSPPRLLRPVSDTAEPWVIADLIDARVRAGVPVEEIAVLTRKNQELFQLYDVLRSRGIPVLLRGKSDLLAHPLVAQILSILSFVGQPLHEARFSSALASSTFHLHPADLARLQAAAREKQSRMRDVLLSVEDASVVLQNRTAVIAARDVLLSLEQQSTQRTVLQTVEAVIRECNLLPVQTQDLTGIDPLDSAAVEAFFLFVKNRCLDRPAYALREFLSDLDFYQDPAYGQVRLTYELPHLSATGVRLMTAHQSKGLEFDVVLLANFRDGHWDDPQQRSAVSVPEDLLYGWDKEQQTHARSEDERRLAFVAATRARNELLLLCPKELTVGEKTRTISPSGFFAEMGTLPEEDVALLDPEGASLLLRPKPLVLDDAMRTYIAERLQTFALSATSLGRFLEDPMAFLQVDVLGQPQFFDEKSLGNLGYGSAVHWALRGWATAVQRGEPFSVEKFLEAFGWYLRERTILTQNQRDALWGMGKDALPLYYAACLEQARPLLHAVERDYRARITDPADPSGKGIAIKGKIDRIDLQAPDSAIATVIDYKTGAPKTERIIRGDREPGTVSRTQEGVYFRQLVFYAVLLEHADPLLRPTEFALEFIGERGTERVRRTLTVTDSEKEDLRTLIRSVWHKIVALDFTPL